MIDKRWFFVGVLIIGVFLVVVFLLPFFLNADAFRPAIEAQLSNTLGRSVTTGKLTFSLMQASLVADEFVISEDPAFSDVPFLQAKALAVGIRVLPFILHRQVEITNLTIDTPSIQLIEHPDGRWNYSSLGGIPSNSSSAGTNPLSSMSVGELKIVNGSALVSSVPATAKPFDYTDVNVTIKQFSFLKSFPFELSAKLPGAATLKLTGEAGPISQKDRAQTPFHAALEVRELNPVSAGLIDPGKGIAMNNDIDGELKSDGTNLISTGKIKASQLQLVPRGSPAQEVVEIDYSISKNLATQEGTISDLAIHAGSGEIHVNGTFKPSAEAMMLNLHLSAPSLPMEDLERLLPVAGIRMPSGSSLQGGTFTAQIAISGPATAATVTGPVEIDNTRLAGFDLGSRIEGLNHLPGTGEGTDIRVLKASVNSTPQGTRLNDIYGEMPQIGTASGEGNVLLSGELDFHLNAKLYSPSEVSSSAKPTASPVPPASKPIPASGRSVPLTITGTAASPSIRANLGAATH